jgi:hypothetical protein
MQHPSSGITALRLTEHPASCVWSLERFRQSRRGFIELASQHPHAFLKLEHLLLLLRCRGPC